MDTIAIILKLLKEQHKTQKELCETLHIGQPKFTDWKTGRIKSYQKYLPQIADFFNVSIDYLLGNTTSQNAVKIPVLGRVQAGIPIEAVEEIIGYEEITQKMADTGEYFALLVNGSSMEPKFSQGDIVIVRKQADVDSGDIAIVLVDGEDATIKKVQKQSNGITLIASNDEKNFPQFYSNDDIKNKPVSILGKVIELRAKF